MQKGKSLEQDKELIKSNFRQKPITAKEIKR
jgi:hypothetical protein